jgi:hypothetical protein
MPECRTVWHPVSLVPDRTKIPMPETVWYRIKGTQSSTRNEIKDAGMPMPAASTSIPMSNYATMVVYSEIRDYHTPPHDFIKMPSCELMEFTAAVNVHNHPS